MEIHSFTHEWNTFNLFRIRFAKTEWVMLSGKSEVEFLAERMKIVQETGRDTHRTPIERDYWLIELVKGGICGTSTGA